MSGVLTKNIKTLLQRCHAGPVTFVYEEEPGGGKERLVRSSISVSQKKHLVALALSGHVAERITVDPGVRTFTYTVTALGREAAGIACPVKPPVHWHPLKTDEELELESRDPKP